MNKLIKSYIANGSFLTKKCVRVCVWYTYLYMCVLMPICTCVETQVSIRLLYGSTVISLYIIEGDTHLLQLPLYLLGQSLLSCFSPTM